MKVEKKKTTETKKEPQGKITVTKLGAEWILKLLEEEGLSPEENALRISVKGGGCSGLMYDMSFEPPHEDDIVFSRDAAKAAVDPKSLEKIDGSMLTYVNRLQGAGFVLVNPNVSGSCGCGKSFAV